MDIAKRREISRQLKILYLEMVTTADILSENGCTEKAIEMKGAAEMTLEWSEEITKAGQV
jgi:hypothetical protein